MRPKALVVEDDDRIIASIEDTLFSIGHKHDWATNQHDAQQMLREHEYDYVLLDLQIPAKPNRGGADKEFGCNLLQDIQRIKGRCRTPVIVMTAYSADCLDLTTELHANGASEFIAKPFSNKGRTLASVIRRVLTDHTTKHPPVPCAGQKDTSPFAGGELTFFASHVDLLGVTIISDRGTGQCMAVLDRLRRKNGDGRFVRMSGEELAAAIRAPGGVGTITGCIQTLRQNIVNRLRKAKIAIGRDDVIGHDEQGYFLRDWTVVRDGDTAGCSSNVPGGPLGVPADIPTSPNLNQRQRWIIDQLKQGIALQRVMVEREFGVGEKTAKRDLSELVQRKMIEYQRIRREGAYHLAPACGGRFT